MLQVSHYSNYQLATSMESLSTLEQKRSILTRKLSDCTTVWRTWFPLISTMV